MAMIPAIYGDYLSNILRAATWSSTVAPSSSYDLTTFSYMNPAMRVRWSVNTVTITATITSALGDILVIPMHNLVGAVLRVSNLSGFSQVLTAPAVQSNGFPPTWVVDLKALDSNAAHRTSATWNFAITFNPSSVIMGGAIAIYGPKTTFLSNMAGDNFAWEYHERETHYVKEQFNEYGTRYVTDYATATKSIEILMRANAAGGTAIRNWFRSNHGAGRPGLFWPDPNVVDGYYGTWQKELDVLQQLTTYKPISMTFTELSKGQVIA